MLLRTGCDLVLGIQVAYTSNELSRTWDCNKKHRETTRNSYLGKLSARTCLRNKKPVETSATLVVTSALLVVTRS